MVNESAQVRSQKAMRVYQSYEAHLDSYVLEEERAQALISSLNQKDGVGTRHHVVPKFLLDNWADNKGRVQVYSRVDRKFSMRTTRDLAIRNFYTFIDIHQQPNAMLEALLGRVESGAGSVLRKLTSSFIKDVDVNGEDLVQLALFAAFQVMRTPRRQREMELQTDWFAKTTMRGHISEDELARLTVMPHKNQFVETVGPMGERLVPFFRARPLVLVTLDQPRLVTGDEPVVVNAATGQDHHADCFLTDEQIAARVARERRKKKRLRRDVSRVVHFWSPVPRGVGTAVEVVLPISSRSALVWGPLDDSGDVLTFEREKLAGAEAEHFASRVNDAVCSQALDWIITRPGDTEFRDRSFPEPGPLLRVCDGLNAASDAINTTPKQMRPRRLTAPG